MDKNALDVAVEALRPFAKASERIGNLKGKFRIEVGQGFLFIDREAFTAAESAIAGVTFSIPDDVRRLVVAAREFWDENNDIASQASNELDRALEAFAARVPYADEPDHG